MGHSELNSTFYYIHLLPERIRNSAEVDYWMPFYGNIGLHDARWRHVFGGEIYKTRGTHGCVNAPYNLAKTVYENIEEGTPFICYEEE